MTTHRADTTRWEGGLFAHGRPSEGPEYQWLRGWVLGDFVFRDSLELFDKPGGRLVARTQNGLLVTDDRPICNWSRSDIGDLPACHDGLLLSSKEDTSLPYFESRVVDGREWRRVRIDELVAWHLPQQAYYDRSLEEQLIINTPYAHIVADRSPLFHTRLGSSGLQWKDLGIAEPSLLRVDVFVDYEGMRYVGISVFGDGDHDGACVPPKGEPTWRGFVRLYGDDGKLNIWFSIGGC